MSADIFELLWQMFAALPLWQKAAFAVAGGLAVGGLAVLLICGSRAALDSWRERERRLPR
jgi:hypothetical protein